MTIRSMSKRKADDAEVQRVVHWIKYVSQEVTLIEMTKAWSEADFLYAVERIETDLLDIPQERREQIRGLYWNLRMERQVTEAHMASEEANIRRHDEIVRQLQKLKEPHWSIVPNFWITVVISILTAIAVIAAFLALHH
jgi:hypothetical protein